LVGEGGVGVADKRRRSDSWVEFEGKFWKRLESRNTRDRSNYSIERIA
jgi:hypothetical protein